MSSSPMDSLSTFLIGFRSVDLYSASFVFSVVLLDLSMPVLDGMSFFSTPMLSFDHPSGIGATSEIRAIEASRPNRRPARILALIGMPSLNDKRRAFEAGVDG